MAKVNKLALARLALRYCIKDLTRERFGMKGRQAQQILDSDGFPIRAVDVVVSYELRAFL